MRVPLVVLPQQIFPIVVAVRGPDDGMDVISVSKPRISRQVARPYRQLMIELDQDHGGVDPVIENARILGAADPRKRRVVQVPPDLIHLHPRKPVLHIPHVGNILFLARHRCHVSGQIERQFPSGTVTAEHDVQQSSIA